ncbi:HPr kinase/phosphorylase [Azospirillum isscasi]|uniref:HPr kinase/phosphatase C-terminal domain-containing protein n=1 Tax=Azospirillum isscasi TaxID=3053926 RepID=A0ABU0WH98_9PROT|nr:HPr kinase/phosphatase C-terminal domain-containing protein [Azospirillum isscasi]MDQ2103590.1 HPr kinase/phosphatase C-terminal domain-containing protein [Azospirillum isscasi]
MVTIHGTCVLVGAWNGGNGDGGNRGETPVGVLLRGPSGSGKSDLALRMIDAGALLVADDRVELRVDQGRLMARAPAALAGLLEVRGVGIMPIPAAAEAEVGLVVDLVPRDAVERLPGEDAADLLDQAVPRLALCPFDASTPAKLKLAAAAARDGSLGKVPDLP